MRVPVLTSLLLLAACGSQPAWVGEIDLPVVQPEGDPRPVPREGCSLVGLTADGKVLFDDERVPTTDAEALSDLVARIAGEMEHDLPDRPQRPSDWLLLRADRDARSGDLVRLVEACERDGVRIFKLALVARDAAAEELAIEVFLCIDPPGAERVPDDETARLVARTGLAGAPFWVLWIPGEPEPRRIPSGEEVARALRSREIAGPMIQLAEDFPLAELARVLLRFDEHGGSDSLLLRGLEE